MHACYVNGHTHADSIDCSTKVFFAKSSFFANLQKVFSLENFPLYGSLVIEHMCTPHDIYGPPTVITKFMFKGPTVQLEIFAGIKFGGWVPNCHSKHIGGFKFGGSVWDRHTYICE